MGVLLLNATAIGPGGTAGPAPKGEKSFHAHLEGESAISATIKIEVSDIDPTLVASSWVTAAIFTMSGTRVVSEGITLAGPWSYWRANMTAISGTSAIANVWNHQ